jgi:hypothetical protein
MAQYTLQRPTFDILPAASVQADWKHISDKTIRKIVSYEVQSYEFQKALLDRLHTRIKRPDGRYTYQPLDFTLRAGHVKAIIASGVSIIEAVLREYGEQKGYISKVRTTRQTLGKILNKWLDSGHMEDTPVPKEYIKPIFSILDDLWKTRNDIHLFKTISSPEQYYKDVINRSASNLTSLEAAIVYLKTKKP